MPSRRLGPGLAFGDRLQFGPAIGDGSSGSRRISSPRDGHHYRIIQSLAHTIGATPDVIARLDAFRKKRNISDYERSGCVSAQEAWEMFVLARSLKKAVKHWIEASHPKLLRK